MMIGKPKIIKRSELICKSSISIFSYLLISVAKIQKCYLEITLLRIFCYFKITLS